LLADFAFISDRVIKPVQFEYFFRSKVINMQFYLSNTLAKVFVCNYNFRIWHISTMQVINIIGRFPLFPAKIIPHKSKTLLDALDKYDRYAGGKVKHFDFPIDRGFIYKVSENIDFIPSVTDLYWMELELFNPENVKGFIQAILGKIEHSKFRPDIVFFDCPPSFTALSYSILSNCSLILVPTNPDVFAATGLRIMIDGLKSRIQPWPNPKVVVFMNKAGFRVDIGLFRETKTFMSFVEQAADELSDKSSQIVFLNDAYVPFRAAIRKSISFGGFPTEMRRSIETLWNNVQSYL
jgi:chromosome partitioning protein